MANLRKSANEHPPLSLPVLQLLLSLSAGDKHGYAIMKEVERDTQGRTRLGPGTLYGAIKRLLEHGLIEESGERVDEALDDQRRRYYRLTGRGRQVLRAELERLESLTRQDKARAVLEGAP